MTFDRLARHVDQRRLRRLLVSMVEQYSPSFAEGPVLEVVSDALRHLGLPFRWQPVEGLSENDERGNLIVELGPRPGALLLVGHLDTIPEWDEDFPLCRVDGDTLYGLGATDMKSGCAALIEALAVVNASGLRLRRGVTLALVVGEEEYGDGSERLIAEGVPECVLIGEPTGLTPCIEQYGYLEIALEARGQRAHAALPGLGASAIHAMLAWLSRLLEAIEEAELSEVLAINPASIRGGSELFVVPERCEASIDVHFAPSTQAGVALDLVAQSRQVALQAHPQCVLEHEVYFQGEAFTLPLDTPFVEDLRRSFELVERPWTPSSFRSHSDASLFYKAGGVPVICGPGRLELAHSQEEAVSLFEVAEAARLYTALIHTMCGDRGNER
jgi:acetylornithine deacetylase